MQRSGIILLADDDRNDASLISYALRRVGIYNPMRWLGSGDAVIHFLQLDAIHEDRDIRQMPLLLLLDWNMPGKDTLTVLKWIRAQPKYLNLLVVVLTGSQDPVQKRLAYQAGANWYIVKSARFTDLTILIQNVRTFWSLTADCETPLERDEAISSICDVAGGA